MTLETPIALPALERLLTHARTQTLERGESLYQAGQRLEHLCWLEAGRLKRALSAPDGRRELALEVIAPGGWALEAAFLLEPPLAQTDCTALEHAKVRCVPRGVALEHLKADAALSHALLLELVRSSAHQTAQLERWQFWTLGARLAAYLLERDRPEGQVLPTNSALAAWLCTVPELVSRKLGEFYRAGWIRLEKRRLWVVRMDALEQLAISG